MSRRFFTLLLMLLLSTAWLSHSYAAHDLWTQEELALLTQVAALERPPRLSTADLSVLQAGFESRLDRIRIAAIRVILLQRQQLGDFWRANAESRPVRGTSAQLLPIVDAALAPQADQQRALIDALPPQTLEGLPKAGTPVPRPVIDGDDPFDQTLLNILIDDAIRHRAGLHKFDAYRLTAEQKTRLAEAAK
jgi:hypothetical protein